MNTDNKLIPEQFDFTPVAVQSQPRSQGSDTQTPSTDSNDNQCGRINFVRLECYPPLPSNPNVQICTMQKWDQQSR